MSKNVLSVRGAREHNLKNVDIDIPKNHLNVFTGVSGSGKSSLAFDTIYAEGQRRYVESLSTYARQFLGIMKKPDVDQITGLSPAISIDQKTVSHNPRSTVGTVTEIYDYLRLLFARIGHPHCPVCGAEIESQSATQITSQALELIKTEASINKIARFFVLSPVVKDKKGQFQALFDNLRAKGYKRVRIDGIIKNLDEDFVLIKTNKHTVEVLVDRLSAQSSDFKNELKMKNLQSRLADSIEQALKLSDGLVIFSLIQDPGFEIPQNPKQFSDHLYSEKFACPVDNIQLPEIEPRSFSFNSPHGACERCSGIGKILTVNTQALFARQLSIKEGGIIPFATIFEHDTWFSRLILQVCKEHEIDPKAPIKTLNKNQVDIILNGTGEQVYKVDGTNRQGKLISIYENFKGVVKELEQKYENTDSDYAKLALEKYMMEITCDKCNGKRLKEESLGITIDKKSISDITQMDIVKMLEWIEGLSSQSLNKRETQISSLIVKEIKSRLEFLKDVGLEYLTLSRSAGTLSGGEAQRIRLASQIGSGLSGVLYVLDEPTIGLHPKDNDRLIKTLKKLRDLDNTVVVVEHDRDVIEAADQVFDFGPKAGQWGGALVAQGSPAQIKENNNSLTGKYLSKKRKISFPKHELKQKQSIKLLGASQYNLKNIDVEFPLSNLIAVTGVSGSGKSTLIVETLYRALFEKIHNRQNNSSGKYRSLIGYENVDKVILIDQSPIGRTPRSNPATYTKVFDDIRDVFTSTRDAKALGYKKGRFSFNVKGGRCEECAGQGQNKIEMQFMPDIWVECDVCHGARYNSQTLEIVYKGKNIADVLNMTITEALEFFHIYPKIMRKLQTLSDVGLDYLQLGQSATTLSGGEAQRIKLATELSKKATGQTVYILDEPTTGLHFADLERLMTVLKILVERGNTAIVVEHNLDVIKNADWIIDLGPGGGQYGGSIVAAGPPDIIAKSKTETAKYLR